MIQPMDHTSQGWAHPISTIKIIKMLQRKCLSVNAHLLTGFLALPSELPRMTSGAL